MTAAPGIVVEGLTFAYAVERTVLDALHFEVAAGETVGLVGPNGAGKTTLFLCLAGVLPITANKVKLGGLDPGVSRDRKLLPRHVGRGYLGYWRGCGPRPHPAS